MDHLDLNGQTAKQLDQYFRPEEGVKLASRKHD